jgi:hypothetical protein
MEALREDRLSSGLFAWKAVSHVPGDDVTGEDNGNEFCFAVIVNALLSYRIERRGRVVSTPA